MMTQMKGFNTIDGMKLAAFCLRQKHSMFLQGSQILTGNSSVLGPSKVNKHDRRAGYGRMTDVALTAQDFAPQRAAAHEKDRCLQNITERQVISENVQRHG